MSKNLFKAIEFAVRAHSGQFRKGSRVPYIIHPLAVAKILIEYECPEEIVIAGILHDTVEDTEVTLKQLQKEFGARIAKIVQGASEPRKSDPWEKRKQHTMEYLKTAPLEVLWVTCADKLDNLRSIHEDRQRIGEAIWQIFNKPKEAQKWYYENLLYIFRSRLSGESGRSIVEEYEKEFKRVFNSNIP